MLAFLKRLLRLARPYRGRLFLGVLFGFLSGFTEPLLVLLVPVVARVVFPGGETGAELDLLRGAPEFLRTILQPVVAWLEQQGAASTNLAKLTVIALIPVVALGRGLCMYLNVYCMQWVAVRTIMDLRTQLFAHLQRVSLSHLQGARTGELMSRISSDTGKLQKTINGSIPTMIKQPVTVLGLLAILVMLHPTLTLLTAILFPVCAIPVVIYARKARKASTGVQNSYAELTSLMHEAFTGNRIVKAYGLERMVVARFRQLSRRSTGHLMRIVRSQEIPGPMIEFFGSLGVAALFYFYAIQSGASPERFIQFVVSVIMMYRPVKDLIRLHSDLEVARAASQRVFELLAFEDPLVEPAQPKAVRASGADIQFDRVTFRYQETPALQDIRLTVGAGRMTALVGASGAGKTTLTNLLLRFYDPQEGVVRIGGVDIREASTRDLRRQIALVTQEVILFNDTIRRNIALGRLGATDDEIVAAAHHAYAHEFIMEKPRGYDTVIGERGASLSGGQRQRIAIARAILRDAPILVLDEATSALDSESERAVQAALEELMKNRTTICIAHRLSTVQKADVIVVLERGRIVEQGTHQDLLERGGVYHKLHAMQFRG